MEDQVPRHQVVLTPSHSEGITAQLSGVLELTSTSSQELICALSSSLFHIQ